MAKAAAAVAGAPSLRAWPADRVERWPLGRIKPYPANALIHTPEQVAQIAASMRRFGVTAPVLVDEDGVLLYGHGRRLAALQLGYTELPVSVARGWPEDDKRAYRVADNQLGRSAEWNGPVLSAELRDLQLAGYDMPLLGFPEAKLVQFLATPRAPDQFREFDENVPTEHCCPSCGYRWSGRADAGEQREEGKK